EILGYVKAKDILKGIEFVHTPKHASWLNMAEIEIGILDKKCLNRRLTDLDRIKTEVDIWQKNRNKCKARINWTFSKEKADLKLGHHYVS
ncbi:MAG: transposase, partial [Deltaproteobacteria bacterium]|nr:transposase [Deltaproteobacteria bacterium]